MYDDFLEKDMFSLEAGEGRTSECSGGVGRGMRGAKGGVRYLSNIGLGSNVLCRKYKEARNKWSFSKEFTCKI